MRVIRPHPALHGGVLRDVMMPGEVMSLLGISKSILHALDLDGTLPAFRTLGAAGPGHRRYYRADVDAHLAANGRAPAPPPAAPAPPWPCYGTRQVAVMFGVTRRAATRWGRKGYLGARKRNGRWEFPAADVQAALAGTVSIWPPWANGSAR